MTALSYLLSSAGLLLSLPAWSLLLLTLCAGRRPRARHGGHAPEEKLPLPKRPRIAVLVPAHNESSHLLPTLQCLRTQLQPGDRLLVIADNCSDDTATVARKVGATVVERQDADRRGKGYALAFGVDALREDPPEVVVVVDADCTVSDGAIAQVAARSQETACPVQMLYLMQAPPGAGLRIRILGFAWLVKNQVRPTGAYRLGGACHLMGTGMAIPWALMSTARLATGHIAEDMKLGVDMALAGYPTQFFRDAQVRSVFPVDDSVAYAQKSRWEHGHLRTLTEELPRLLIAALRTGRLSLLVLAMDLLIPPLALYFLMLAGLVPLGVLCGLLGPAWHPLAALMVSTALAFGLAIGLSWWRHARQLLSLRELVSSPLYAIWKIPVYVAYAMRKRSAWVRTQRT